MPNAWMRRRIPVQVGVGLGDGGEDAAALAHTVTRARVAKNHRAASRDPGNAMILPSRERSRVNSLLRLLADCSRPATREAGGPSLLRLRAALRPVRSSDLGFG